MDQDDTWAQKTIGLRYAVVQLPKAGSEAPALSLGLFNTLKETEDRVHALKQAGFERVYVQTVMDFF